VVGDKAEVLARARFRAYRFARQEILQLAEILVDPVTLRDMLLDLSAQGAKGPDPSEIIRIAIRMQNTLLMRSTADEQAVGRILSEALKIPDPKLRVEILTECLKSRLGGKRVSIMDLFAFTPSEWASALLKIMVMFDAHRPPVGIYIPPVRWRAIAPDLARSYQMFYEDDSFERASLAVRLCRIPPRKYVRVNNPVADIAERESRLNHVEVAEKLAEIDDEQSAKITMSYARTLLGLLSKTSDPIRFQQLVAGFFEQVHQALDTKSEQAAQLMHAFQKVVENKSPGEREAISHILAEPGQKLIAKMLALFGNIGEGANRGVIGEFLLSIRYFGDDAVRAVLDKCWFQNPQAELKEVTRMVFEIADRVTPLLTGMLNPGDVRFDPSNFARAMSLYLALAKLAAKPLIVRCLQSDSAAIRKAVLLRLAQSEQKALATPILREVLFEKGGKTTVDEMIIAAYGLGVLGDRESADDLLDIAEKSSLFGKGANMDLRLAALYAYARLEGKKNPDEIGEIYKRITRTGLGRLVSWKPVLIKESRQ